jgi:hypothetical protein
MPEVNTVIEGNSDQGFAEALLATAGLTIGRLIPCGGKPNLLKKLAGYNSAAAFSPWFVLVDLDHDADSAEGGEQLWLPSPERLICFHAAVRMIESWMLADAERAASFLGVSLSTLPSDPESIADPKELVVNLARRSRKRLIRDGLVPRPNSGARIGPTYVSDISAFGAGHWRPQVAAEASPSLQRCLDGIAALAAKLS